MSNTDMQTKLVEINKDVKNIQKKSNDIIVNSDSIISVCEFLKLIVARKKRIEELRQFFVKPLNDHVKQINASFKQASIPLETIEKEVKDKMMKYRRIEAEKLEKERQRKLKEAEKLKTESLKEERIEQAQSIKQETKIESESGAVRARKVWKFELINANEIPREYLMVNETAIRRAVLEGAREIPGVRIYEDEVLGVY